MAGFLLSVPGKLNTIITNVGTLLTNWPAVKAALIDVATSSRAPAATALDNTIWTQARAAALDNVTSVATQQTTLNANPILSAPTAIVPAPTQTNLATFASAQSGLSLISQGFPSSGYKTVINLTGRGVVDFLALKLSSNSGAVAGGTYGCRLTIDGVVIINNTALITYTNLNFGAAVIGMIDNSWDPVLEQIPFKTSFLWEVYCNQAAGTVSTYTRYRTNP